MNKIPKLEDWIAIPMMERYLKELTPLYRATIETLIDSTNYDPYHIIQAAIGLQKFERGEDYPLIWNELVVKVLTTYLNIRRSC